MIREDLYRSKARCVYEMAPHCEGHDRESGARKWGACRVSLGVRFRTRKDVKEF